jgi:hypothetical protein
MMKTRATRRFLIAVIAAVPAAVWTGDATAAPPQRTVTFDVAFTFTSPFCGDAIITDHDVGRITFTSFVNADGTPRAFTTHDAATTTTLTNTETGATLTLFYSNFVDARLSVDPRTGVITELVSFNGLNFLGETLDGTPFVSAGRAELTFLVTFDADGNPIFTPTGVSETPKIVHLTQLLCAP